MDDNKWYTKQTRPHPMQNKNSLKRLPKMKRDFKLFKGAFKKKSKIVVKVKKRPQFLNKQIAQPSSHTLQYSSTNMNVSTIKHSNLQTIDFNVSEVNQVPANPKQSGSPKLESTLRHNESVPQLAVFNSKDVAISTSVNISSGGHAPTYTFGGGTTQDKSERDVNFESGGKMGESVKLEDVPMEVVQSEVLQDQALMSFGQSMPKEVLETKQITRFDSLELQSGQQSLQGENQTARETTNQDKQFTLNQNSLDESEEMSQSKIQEQQQQQLQQQQKQNQYQQQEEEEGSTSRRLLRQEEVEISISSSTKIIDLKMKNPLTSQTQEYPHEQQGTMDRLTTEPDQEAEIITRMVSQPLEAVELDDNAKEEENSNMSVIERLENNPELRSSIWRKKIRQGNKFFTVLVQ